MTILPVIAICGLVLAAAYVVYGRLLNRLLGVDPNRTTPAVQFNDGNDFVPAPAPVVLGGHFTAIAAAGPVVGPILAGLMFGWLPALLWILLGAIFIGGVHDAAALFASIRHRATSITQIVREHMSRPAYLTFLIFVWICLVYVVIAFADVTASSFAKLESFNVGFAQPVVVNGGAVVIGATAYLLTSVLMGLALRFTRIPWWVLLGAAVVLLSVVIWKAPAISGWFSQQGLSFMDTAPAAGTDLGSGGYRDAVAHRTQGWDQALLLYCFVASVTPMWLLLQPRGVVGATFLYAALFFGVVGMLVGGWSSSGSLAIRWPMFRGFVSGSGEYLFPFLFITIACGACSGFHSIVASGTTCKQVRTEKDIRPVAYGAMLLEGLVALFALSCVMVMAPGTKTGSPDAVYARGLGNFMSLSFNIPLQFGIGFGLLAFSSFVFDTLDVCTRLGRYVMQELLGMKGLLGGALATLLTLAGPSLYLVFSPPGSFRTFWTIFGTSNQLLAALTLVGISVWLWRTRRPVWFVLLPAIFMVATTTAALVLNFWAFLSKYQLLRTLPADQIASRFNLRTADQVASELKSLPVNMGIAVVLFGLSALVVVEAVRVWRVARAAPVAVVAE